MSADKDVHETTDLYWASYMMLNGAKLMSVVKEPEPRAKNGQRAKFIVQLDAENCAKLKESYFNNNAEGNINHYLSHMRALRSASFS